MTVQADHGNAAFTEALHEAGFRGARGRAQFGIEIGVDGVTVWRWATGRSRPHSHATRETLAAALGRTTDEIEAMFPEHDANGAAA